MPLDGSRFATAFYESQNPTELSQQPLSLTADAKPGDNWDQIFPMLEQRRQSLLNWGWSWRVYCGEVALYTLPRRYHWLVTPNTYDRGRPINDAIIDGTAIDAVTVCAAGMWSGLTSPSRPWKQLGVALPWVNLDAEALNWLYDSNQRLDVVLSQSNFYDTMAQAFQDVAVFGTAPVIIYEDAEDVIRCYLPCCGEYSLAVGSRLTVDTLYREFNLTVLGIVEMYGLENCPGQVREMWKRGGGNLDREFTVCTAIEPNIAMPGKFDEEIRVIPGSFPYREVHWLRGMKTERELSRRGFWEKPFFTARWAVTSNDPYGRSPGMQALGDNKQLQLETRRKAEFLEKGVRPPMGAHPSLKNQPSSIRPGDITYTPMENGKPGFWPLYEVSPQWMEPMTRDIEQIQKRIETAFFVPTFLAITQMEGVQPRNELEITKRDLERLQVLGPFVNLFEGEVSNAIMRVLAIMERKRLLLPRPASMRGLPLSIQYRSIMKIAQEAAETASMERTFQVSAQLSLTAKESGRPDPSRILDLEGGLRHYAQLTAFPANLLRTPQEVAAMDQAAATKAAQQQAVENIKNVTPPVVQAAQAAGNIQIGNGRTALQSILGQ